jgi:hypothetical protein
VIIKFECDEGHLFAVVDPDVERDGDLTVHCPLCGGPVDVRPNDVRLDPREMTGGGIHGPGGKDDYGMNIIDTTNAILVDEHFAAWIDEWNTQGQGLAFALTYEGRIHRQTDRAQVMLIGDLAFLAGLVAEAHRLARGAHKGAELMKLCEEYWQEINK